ncbi:MAG TPA: NAD(P)H-binding protein [Candidatus Limnocylindrales bacterium]
MSQTILVTGATGKTGRRLIPLLARRGVTIRAASRSPIHTPTPGVEPIRFDWADESTYEPSLKGVDAIYLVPGDFFTPGDPSEQIRVFLKKASHAGVQRAVLLSAFGADSLFGVGDAPPAEFLRQVELTVETSGLSWTHVRPGGFMQNFSEGHFLRLTERIREHDEIVHPGGDGLVSWVSTEDIAAVAAATLTLDGHAGKAYSVLGPQPLTLAEVAAHISAAAGRPIKYVPTPPNYVRDSLVALGLPPEPAGAINAVYEFSLGSGAYGAHNDDVERVTGRPPATFAEFAAGAAAAWRR